MLRHVSSLRALLTLWAGTIVLVIASAALSAVFTPEPWRYFWLVPTPGSWQATLRLAGTMWLGIWEERPFEALSLAVVALTLLLTLGWLVARAAATLGRSRSRLAG